MKLLEYNEDNLITYTLYEVAPKIYVVEAADDYSRAMLFVRAQEYYESAYSEFRKKTFCIFEYMNKYRKERGTKYFGYTKDWSGYNIPSDSLESCLTGLKSGKVLTTPYDTLMHTIHATIRQHQPRGKFYILGVDDIKSQVMDHELSHALFYTNKQYKAEMVELVLSLKSSVYDQLEAYLSQMGYVKQVIVDEIHAYLSTGLIEPMDRARGSIAASKKFKKVFKEYRKTFNLKLDV
ncbi:hypothetical protein UFOVP1604_94 [uncultured Caudovirales phage]|uniref:Uncharacterized protein n=1 Tax=uncultured Caudovirales phage TaxID=2100421 RepID=A0A6J5SWK1_9CAUD|nr:hypothetical protein UFOVP1604_94 [uncultured Caudovirales phage]